MAWRNWRPRISLTSSKTRKREPGMTDEESDRIIELLLADQRAGLKAFSALTMEEKKQVLERAEDERINQIVAEADFESATD